jgi:glycosyltransferase involved in cell wall biosynthesis
MSTANTTAQKKVLVISPIATHPANAGNRIRIFQMLEIIRRLGHVVHFAYLPQSTQEAAGVTAMRRYWKDRFHTAVNAKCHGKTPAFRKEGAQIRKLDDWYDHAFDGFLSGLSTSLRPDVVLVEYALYSKVFEFFGRRTLKVIDTHDILANRRQRLERYGIKYPDPVPSLSLEEEKQALNRADAIIAIQDHERDYFSRLTDKKVLTVGHYVEQAHPSLRRGNRDVLLFVGSRSRIGKHNIEFFLERIFPLIRKRLPRARLLIAGRICELMKNDTVACEKLGYVENLKKIFQTSGVFIKADVFATGLSIKTITALGYACPVVTTSMGARGLEDGINDAFWVADTPVLFAEKTIELLTNSSAARRLSARAFKYIRDYNRRVVQGVSDLFAEKAV